MPISSRNPFEKIIDLYTTTCPVCKAVDSFLICQAKIQTVYENDHLTNIGWYCKECGVILFEIPDKYATRLEAVQKAIKGE
uniref:Uncharacterized protein n=1 Tax=viral metagenome TaxID=1070528 RepID=A0A6M3JJG8_9ZZZZ